MNVDQRQVHHLAVEREAAQLIGDFDLLADTAVFPGGLDASGGLGEHGWSLFSPIQHGALKRQGAIGFDLLKSPQQSSPDIRLNLDAHQDQKLRTLQPRSPQP